MLLLDYQFWPSLQWMVRFYQARNVVLEQHGNYQKQSLFNRSKIAGVNGVITLSVPLEGGREQKKLLQDVRIDHSQRWALQQIRTLQSCYAKSPFFDYYFPVIETLLKAKPEFMIDMNRSILQKLVQWLQWKGDVSETEAFTAVNKQDFSTFTHQAYFQVFSDRYAFIDNLSVLDALFCLGPQLKDYLLKQEAY